MKFLGVIGLISAANAFYVPLFRSPSLDTAVVHSERFNGGFAYNSIENHAYVPAAAQPQVYYYFVTYPGEVFPNNFVPSVNPQYPNVIYTQPVGPTVGQNPFIPGGGGWNPNRPPIEVEDPADGSADEIREGSNSAANNDDDDSVTIEALK